MATAIRAEHHRLILEVAFATLKITIIKLLCFEKITGLTLAGNASFSLCYATVKYLLLSRETHFSSPPPIWALSIRMSLYVHCLISTLHNDVTFTIQRPLFPQYHTWTASVISSHCPQT
jgi:hypothetical protein